MSCTHSISPPIFFNILQHSSTFCNILQHSSTFFNILQHSATYSSTGLGALRTFRLMRVFKLARSWKDLQKLLLMIMQSVMDVTNAVALLGIIMFIFTLLGMQLFGGKMKWYYYGLTPGDKAKAHFDSFWWGFVTVFQVLTGENWNEVLYVESATNCVTNCVYGVLNNIDYYFLPLFFYVGTTPCGHWINPKKTGTN